MRRRSVFVLSLIAILAWGAEVRAGESPMGPLPEISAPGRAATTGTWMAVTQSEYLDVTVSSSEVVRMAVDSVPRTIQLRFEPAGAQAASTVVTVGGLPPATRFYLYRDDAATPVILVSDETGSCSFVQGIVGHHVVFLQPDHSTYFLGDAGWTNDAGTDLNGVVGTWDGSTRSAVLLGDLGETIHVTGDNIVLDGNGHTLSGSGVGNGIYLNERSGITVKNLRIRNFSYGVSTFHSTQVLVQGNDVRACETGIYTDDNNGITVRENTFDGCPIGFYAYGFYNYTVLVEGNNFTNCSQIGAYSVASQNITFRDNVVSQCGTGVYLLFTMTNTFANNVLANNTFGFYFNQVHQTVVTDNVISNSGTGVELNDYCQRNSIYRNEISGNSVGYVSTWGTEINFGNYTYNNNFLLNAIQIDNKPNPYYTSYNYYNQPLPIGGNYWSDWTGPDSDGDGFVDLPYVFTDGQDNLPLVAPVMLPNHRPVLNSVGDLTGAENELLSFVVTAFDVDGDPVNLSAANLPPGATFDPATGTFFWIPGYDQAGTYPGVEFTAADNAVPAGRTTERITIAIANVNRPPVFQPVGSQQVTEYRTLQFTVSAQDPDGDVVTLSASGLPAGATFNPVTGTFTWTPDGTQVGVHTVSFFAVDNGSPAQTGQLDVRITVVDDTVAPTVTSTYPANLVIEVPRAVAPRIIFSETVTAGPNYSRITFKKGKTAIAFQKSILGNVLTLTPAAALASRNTYIVTIPAGAVQDLAGNPGKSFTFQFTTGKN